MAIDNLVVQLIVAVTQVEFQYMSYDKASQLGLPHQKIVEQ